MPMNHKRRLTTLAVILAAAVSEGIAADAVPTRETACKALLQIPNLTVIWAELRPATETAPQYCYIRGIISPALPLPCPASAA